MRDARQNFLMRFGVLEAILGSFAFLTVPLLVMQIVPWPDGITAKNVGILYFVCFGASHFFVTFAIYCNRENLAYFLSDGKNVVLYFLLPLAITAGSFYLNQFHPWNKSLPFLMPIFALTVRAADFLHVQRQSYGVLQLLKGSTGLKFSGTSRTLEKLFFPLMAIAAWITLARVLGAGPGPWKRLGTSRFYEFVHNEWILWSILTLAAAVFLMALGKLIESRGTEGSLKQRYSPVVYFVLQSAAVTLAVIDFRLYAVGLAMHYTEYHLLVYQRSFKAKGSAFRDTSCPLGRRIALVLGFYVVIVGVSVAFAFMPKGYADEVPPGDIVGLSMNNLFLTVIIFHFYIDALIWRFRKPFYRETLGPVYFGPK